MNNNDDTRSIYQLIRSAFTAQKNNKLHSVVISFQYDLKRLNTILETSAAQAGDREVSDATIRRHPIAVLYAAHICKLTASEVADRTNDAYAWCEGMLQQEDRMRQLIPIPTDSN